MSIRIEPGVTTFNYTYADGRPEWTVIRARGNDTYDCEVLSDMDWTGAKKVFGGEEIRAAIQQTQAWDRSIKGSKDFFETLKVGDIVHYHNGFGCFVRCEVIRGVPERNWNEEMVEKNLLQPIALVGAWKGYDLPKRRPNGEIEYPYHAEKVVNRTGAWQPHDSNVYESPSFGRKAEFSDPQKMPVIDLSVPGPTAEEAELIRLTKLRDEAVALLNDYENTRKVADLRGQIMQALSLLNKAVGTK